MILTAVLTVIVLWCLFYGSIPGQVLIFFCLIMGGTIAVFGRHKKEGFLIIDILVRKSRLYHVNASLKFWTTIILMILCISSNSAVIGIFLAIVMLFLTVIVGGFKIHDYMSMLVLPVSFLLLSGLALLIEYGGLPAGVLNLPFFHGYLSVMRTDQIRTALVMSKAFGAISCLYMLSLSTPMSDIIEVLKRAHVPDVIVELMYLIYRYTFLLIEMYYSMKNAAKSRLGDIDYRTSLRTTGSIYSNLLARSYRQANNMFDAMESRCFEGEIRFLESRKNMTLIQVITAAGIMLITLGLRLC